MNEARRPQARFYPSTGAALLAALLVMIISIAGLYPVATPLVVGFWLGMLGSFAAAYLGAATGSTPQSGSLLVRLVMLLLIPPIGSIVLWPLSRDIAKGFTFAGLTCFILIQGLLAFPRSGPRTT